ncbi:MAG: hypothetical protein KJO69_07565 [Gammaproteobacteria bacterium]|nr:hypothetical protein [Gammaproteobacteria bacterium]
MKQIVLTKSEKPTPVLIKDISFAGIDKPIVAYAAGEQIAILVAEERPTYVKYGFRYLSQITHPSMLFASSNLKKSIVRAVGTSRKDAVREVYVFDDAREFAFWVSKVTTEQKYKYNKADFDPSRIDLGYTV